MRRKGEGGTEINFTTEDLKKWITFFIKQYVEFNREETNIEVNKICSCLQVKCGCCYAHTHAHQLQRKISFTKITVRTKFA